MSAAAKAQEAGEVETNEYSTAVTIPASVAAVADPPSYYDTVEGNTEGNFNLLVTKLLICFNL